MALLFRTNGTTEVVTPAERTFTLPELHRLIECETIDILRVPADRNWSDHALLVIDDDGMRKESPINLKASNLYGIRLVGNVLRCSTKEVD